MDTPKKFVKKPTRSKSGIVPLTVVLPPKKCNHGTCLYCPGGDFVPQSYTDKSPAIMRAMALNYDVTEQVKTRLNSIMAMGHPTDKLEVIIIGGTFLEYENDFKYNYIKGIYDALNGVVSKDLDEAKKINETAKNRIVALCIENRPDSCSEEEIKQMLSYGTTRIEIGVQMPDDFLYKKVNRGHSVEEVVSATKRLKDSGFKVGYHIMPGLPFSTIENDKEKFKLVFSDSRFRPDQLKIYPCQIIESSPLSRIYKKINYRPYTNSEIHELVKWMMHIVPRYCRVMRMMREIPKEKMKVEAASTSMRSDIFEELKNEGGIEEIRFREIGRQFGKVNLDVFMKETQYDSSDGKEIFLEFVNKNDNLFGLLRLRFPSKGVFISELKNAAIVRELHVYGQALKLGDSAGKSQHRGLGKKLLAEAEKISKKEGYKKIAVISGVGVREYYSKLGYKLEGDFMVKYL